MTSTHAPTPGPAPARARAPLTLLADALPITADPTDGRAPILSTRAELTQPASAVTSAELLATAHGIYEPTLNGSPATDTVLNPGWTVYESRLQVQRFDVTEQVRAGDGALEVSVPLGRGWWNGDFGFGDAASNYGDENAFLAALVITYADGSTQQVLTDESWT
ncbi:MAG: alpha-L-rhamnosidase N-terminal domain-containing protein, partial [Brachybacterium tyrofermentans]